MPPTMTQLPMLEFIVQPLHGTEQTVRAATALEAARLAFPSAPPGTLAVRPGADGWRITQFHQNNLIGVVWRAWRVVPAGDPRNPEPGFYASQSAAAREAERLSRRRGFAYAPVQRSFGGDA